MAADRVVSAARSALVVLVPEAEPLVGAYRDRHDRSAAEGMPAHVTVLYPFAPPAELDDGTLAALEALCAGAARFRFSLGEVRRFPGVVYLAPEPAAPFGELTRAVAERFPRWPPYGGTYPDVVPHLTVAQVADPAGIAAIEADFRQAARQRLPIPAAATELALMDDVSGRWTVRRRLPLGGAR